MVMGFNKSFEQVEATVRFLGVHTITNALLSVCYRVIKERVNQSRLEVDECRVIREF